VRCWFCKNEACGICHECGRAVCEEHAYTDKIADNLHCELHKH
jgi:hypothetical protein